MNDYIVFDLETSGLSIYTAEVVEIAALKVCNGCIIDTFSSFVKPSHAMDPNSTAVNGITDDMLIDAPAIEEILPIFIDFIGDSYLLGHNISSFDLPIIQRLSRKYLGYEVNNFYIDTLQMARSRMGFLPNKKLTTIAVYFSIDTSHAHRALDDCRLTKECYERMCEMPECKTDNSRKHKHRSKLSEQTKALQTLQGFLMGIIADNVLKESEVMALKKWLDDNADLSGQYPFDRVFSVVEKSLEDGVLEQSELDEMLKLFGKFTDPVAELSADTSSITTIEGKNICVTGDFSHGERKYIQKIISEHGGVNKSSVTGRTDYVVIGSLGSPDWSYGSYGGKVRAAMELIEKGKSIQIIKEEDFFTLIEPEGGIDCE